MRVALRRAVLAALLTAAGCAEAADPARDVDAPSGPLRTVADGILTVGADIPYPPFANQDLTGFDLDLARAIAGQLGLRPRTEDSAFDGLFDRVAAGEFDIAMAATPISPELEAIVNFSQPYFRVHQALVVDAAFRPNIRRTADLGQGDSVAVQDGSTGQAWAREHLEPAGAELRTYPDSDTAAQGLATGIIDALLVDEISALAVASSRPELAVVETVVTGEGLGIAVDPGNPDLLSGVNEALEALVADGTYDLIYDRYAGSLPPEGRITAPAGEAPASG